MGAQDARIARALPASAGEPCPGLIEDLVAANHILCAERVLDGFGHVSVRHDRNVNRFLLSRNMAPALVTAGDIVEFDLDGNPVNAHGRPLYLEISIHGAIYKARPDVMAIVHSHSHSVIPFGVTGSSLRPVFHMAAFLGNGAPIFEIRTEAGMTDLLIRNNELGDSLARSLGDSSVVLMRGHGSTAVGNSLQQAVFRAVYAETNARLQADAGKLGPITFLAPEEAEKATETIDACIGRSWDLWKRNVSQDK